MAKKKKITIAPQKGKQEMALNLKVDVLIYGGAAGCYDGNTEFLTPNGWVKFKDYCEGMEVAEYSTNADTLTYAKPLDYIKLPCNTLSQIKGKGLQMTLSDEHTVLYWNENKSTLSPPKTLPFHEVKNRHNKSKTKGWTGKIKTTFQVDNPGIDLSEGEIRLQVICKADGSFTREGKDNYCRIRVSKERKYERILEICKKYNLKYKDFGCQKDDSYKNGKLHTVIVWPTCNEKRYDSKWWNCNQEQLDIIADEVCHWDGSIINGGKTLKYYSKYKSDCDFIQYVFSSQGLNTSLVRDKREGKEYWTTNGQKFGKGFRSFANKDGKNELVEVPTSDGFKYCFTTNTGFLLVREEDKVYLSGNSGKSRLLLMKPLAHMKDPDFQGIFFRRNIKALEKPGGLWPESKKLYTQFKTVIRERDHKHTFKSGCSLMMDHLELESDAEANHQGTQYSFIGFDELTHFEQSQFLYLIGRMRSESDSDSFTVATCNPDPDSWVMNWVEWYLDEDGFPEEDKCGKIRYFVVVEDNPVFADTPEELVEEYPYLCYQEDDEGNEMYVPPMSFAFVNGTIFDNPALIKANPKYLSALKAQSRVNRERLLDGNWFARPEGSSYIHRSMFKKTDKVPMGCVSCRSWDKASSEPSDKNRYPDYTASVMWHKDRNGYFYVTGDYVETAKDPSSEIYGIFRKRPGDRDNVIEAQAKRDGSDTTVVLPIDPGSAGKVEYAESAKKLNVLGYKVKPDPMPNNKSKLTRFEPVSSAVENGLVYIIESSFKNKKTLDEFYRNLESFDGEPSTSRKKDDWGDAFASGYNFICKAKAIPKFDLPSDAPSTMVADLRRDISI